MVYFSDFYGVVMEHLIFRLPSILKPSRFKKIKSLSEFQAINNPDTEILSKLNESEQEDILLKLTDAIESHVNKNILQ